MTIERKELGARGEEAAARHLRRQGFRILHRNFTCSIGEIDITARKGNLLAIVEVKTRRSDEFAPPEMSVTATKKRRIARLATHYARRFGLESLVRRFDIVAVVMEPSGRVRLEHFQGAFDAPSEF